MKIFNFQFSIFNYSLSRAEGSKGFTLIELLVAMGIFLTVITLAVGSVVSAQRFQGQVNLERQLQQLAREVVERISIEVRNANGWVDANGNLLTYKPFEVSFETTPEGNFLKIRRHEGKSNIFIVFKSSGGYLDVGISRGSITNPIPSDPTSFSRLVGPTAEATYKITSTNIFFITPSDAFESTSSGQPYLTGIIPFEATFGNKTVKVTLPYSVASRFYNFKYSY